VAEMECMEGKEGSKVLLTLIFRNCTLMLIFLLENQDLKCVLEVNMWLEAVLGRVAFSYLYKREIGGQYS